MNKIISITPIQGRIILYCKGHYKYDDFFEGLKMIWAIRCGYNYKYTSKDTLTYIANDMFEIIMKCKPNKIEFFMDKIHRNINDNLFFTPKNLSPIEALVWEYRSILCTLQIKEKINKNYKTLIKIPSKKESTMNRILKGKGKYNDYELITK